MLQTHEPQGIPPQTAVVTKAAFPKGSLVMALRDELGTVYTDEQFRDLCLPSAGSQLNPQPN